MSTSLSRKTYRTFGSVRTRLKGGVSFKNTFKMQHMDFNGSAFVCSWIVVLNKFTNNSSLFLEYEVKLNKICYVVGSVAYFLLYFFIFYITIR